MPSLSLTPTVPYATHFASPLSRRLAGLAALSALALGSAAIQAAPADAYLKGAFGPVVNWPIMPIHAVLLPDGRVMSYGTDNKGNQTGLFAYDVWDPTQGTTAASHLTLPNTTGTDTFCSGQIVLPSNGAVLLMGGDRVVNKKRNYSVADVNLFDYRSSALYKAPQPMADERWYPTSITLSNGEVLILGGRSDPTTYVSVPEVYSENTGWRRLVGADSVDAYGARNWSYPRAWQAPNGKVFISTIWGGTYYLDASGTGSVTRTPLNLRTSHYYLPSVMFAPGKILSLRNYNSAQVIDITGATPKATSVTGVGQERLHGSATVMADGQVLVNGGSLIDNWAFGVAYAAKIWNPATSKWATAAKAAKMRLYHSVALLLPDATILTGGGGAPGPVTNLNAEIYTPPYLFKKDRTGTLAPRPVITDAPTVTTWKQAFTVDTNITGADRVSKVTFIKTGSVTHTIDFDQRLVPVNYTTQATARGTQVTITAPDSADIATPGYYMVFVFNSAGVPSVAKIIRLS